MPDDDDELPPSPLDPNAAPEPVGPLPPVGRLTAFERHLVAQARAAHQREEELLPAWLRPTAGEHRWQMALAVVVAIALQVALPHHLTTNPHYALPIAEGLLLIALLVANPGPLVRHSAGLHVATLALLALISAGNAISAGLLVHEIVTGTGTSGSRLLLEGVDIWLTNIVVFGLWYWEFDRGGPVQRAHAVRRHPDLLFPQMQQPEVAPAEWEPNFFDYLYVSFTNATAFSPTDTMPLSRWAKALFLLQSAISLVTVALVISRAVNIFREVTPS